MCINEKMLIFVEFVTVQSQAKYFKMTAHACMDADIFIIFYLADTPQQENT